MRHHPLCAFFLEEDIECTKCKELHKDFPLAFPDESGREVLKRMFPNLEERAD